MYNKLKKSKKRKSLNQVTGKVKNNVDLELVTNKNFYITDMTYEYYNSKFQFSDFFNKELMGDDWIKKPPFLLALKKGVRYKQTPQGIDFAFNHLVTVYQDLDKNLTRLAEGYHDAMFVKFVCLSGVFTTQHHWEMLLRNWHLAFSYAITRYYNNSHKAYRFDSTVNYVAYFDMFFSRYLAYAIARADQRWKEDISQSFNHIENQYVRLDQLPNNITTLEDV